MAVVTENLLRLIEERRSESTHPTANEPCTQPRSVDLSSLCHSLHAMTANFFSLTVNQQKSDGADHTFQRSPAKHRHFPDFFVVSDA